MTNPVLVLSTIVAVGALSSARVGAAPQEASKPQAAEAAQPAPSPAPAADAVKERVAGQAPGSTTRKPRYLKMIQAEFRALDLDKKTLTFETDDGKSYTVEAQVPTRQDTLDRAAKLAEVLKPGDRIRMLCKVNEKEEPTLILSLHMEGPAAPMQYR